MTYKFACPKCQKSIKATPELAGKVAQCPSCGAKLKVPAPQPAAAGAARHKAASKAKPAPAQDALPFDEDEWEQELNPFEAPETDAADEVKKLHSYGEKKKFKKKDFRWTKRGLLMLDFGLLIGGMCYLLQIVMGIIGVDPGDTLNAVIGGFYLLAATLMLIGPYFCILVPENTGAKQMAITSATAQTIAIGTGIAMFYAIGRAVAGPAGGQAMDATELVGAAAILFIASVVSYFTFVNFLKKLALFLGIQEIADSAQTVLMIGAFEAFCIVLAFIMPLLATSMTDMLWLGTVSLLCYITAVIGGYIAAFMYVGCIFRLSREMPG